MKQWLQRLRSHFGSVSALMFVLYTTFVVAAQAYYCSWYSPIAFWVVCLATLLLSAAFGPVLLRRLSRLHVCPREQQSSAGKRLLINSCFYLLPLGAFLCYFIAYFPGGFSYDSSVQYAQAVTNQYNDWHPALHTLLAFKLPLVLTDGWPGSMVLFQLLFFCGAIGYTCQVIRKLFGVLPAVITMAWIILNPLVMITAMYPWKDVGFAVCALLMGTYALQTVITKGKWLRSPVNMLCFIVVAVIATIIRHNGILFTGPVILGMALSLSRKRALAFCMGIVLLFAAIKGPVYSVLGVKDPEQRTVEVLGLPMTVIAAVAYECPERMDEESLEFIYRVTPKEVLEREYHLGNFNSIKNCKETDLDVIEQYGAAKVLSIMLRCIKAAPATAVRSLRTLTGSLYHLKYNIGLIFPTVGENEYGIVQAGDSSLFRACDGYVQLALRYLSPVFMYLGLQHWILLAFVLAKISVKQKKDWLKLLIVLGVFCYNFGSGLLLSSLWDASRFFFYTFPLMPVLLLVICYNDNERSKPLFAWCKKCKKF